VADNWIPAFRRLRDWKLIGGSPGYYPGDNLVMRDEFARIGLPYGFVYRG
jgi:hypothetical protein